ncbi:MAG: DUF559 domain-containing protein [Bacteroidia bacterium]|nr:DUF559 domain-containing protein [Bacteroidia bacterium]
MKNTHNRKELKSQRKYLRNHATSAEAVFWKYLKNKQVGGLKFRRQHSIGSFIVDFYCPTLKLAIELDGEPHATQTGEEHDNARDRYLQNQGIVVIRFENRYAFDYPKDIIEEILKVKEYRESE